MVTSKILEICINFKDFFKKIILLFPHASGSKLEATNKSGWRPCSEQFCSLQPCDPVPPPVAYDLVARSAEGEWFPVWVWQSGCKMCILPQFSTWCPSCQGRQHIGGCDSGRRIGWIALSSVVLKAEAVQQFFPYSVFFLKWIYSTGRH